MSEKKIKLLQEFEIYANPDLGAQKIATLPGGHIVDFNREKRRGGINWLEIYLEDGTKGYINKEDGGYFVVMDVWLADEIAYGFNYTQKTSPSLSLEELFFTEGHFDSSVTSVGKVEVRSIQDSSEDKEYSLFLNYDKDVVEVEEFNFTKDDMFSVYNVFSAFFEVDDGEGKKGYLLNKTQMNDQASRALSHLGLLVGVGTVLLIFFMFLSAGWIVVGGWMVLVGIVVALIVIFLVQLLFSILYGAFQQVRKRF